MCINVFLCASQGIDGAALQEAAVGAGQRLHREELLERTRTELPPPR